MLGLRPRAAAALPATIGVALTATALLFHPLTLPNLLAGLEQPLLAALLTLLTVALLRNRRWLAAAAALALSLSRPEGALLGAAAAVADLAAGLRRREPIRRLLAPWTTIWAAPLAAAIAWRWWYFRDLIPNSVRAKAGEALATTVRGSLPLLADFLHDTWPLLLVAAAALALHLRRAATPAVWVALAPAATLLLIDPLIAVGDPYYGWHRYLYPILPLLAAGPLVVAGELSLAGWEPARRRALRLTVIGATAVAVVWMVRYAPVLDPGAEVRRTAPGVAGWSTLWGQDRSPDRHLTPDPTDPRLAHFAASRWLLDHARPGETVATAEIGAIGYYTGLRVVDIFGLVNPDLRRAHDRPGWKE